MAINAYSNSAYAPQLNANRYNVSNNDYSPLQARILDMARSAPDPRTGISISDCVIQLRGFAGEGEIRNAIEWLSGEGHLYNTIDDEHFGTTDG